ncbi:MAG: proline racemase family protein [Candidatus Latescibacteria bacterium]|nr:proline racemase family protein [Candidatus Latescibacterota bacterium]
MEFEHLITAIDSHTAGEPTRIVTGGLPFIPGKSMAEKKHYLREKLDYVRTALIQEPRGYRDMFGAILVPPVSGEADLGVVFIGCGRYYNMCGHGSIGIAVVALKMGWIEAVEPFTDVVLDTPAGLIRARVAVKDGKIGKGAIRNVPCFLHTPDFEVEVPGVGTVRLDIAFGGNFFALVEAGQLGMEIEPEYAEAFQKKGLAIREAVNRRAKIVHPVLGHITGLEEVMFYAGNRNVVILGEGSVDRSPCGTGTSARMAALFAKGELELGQEFVHESIIGTRFYGRLVEEASIGDFRAVVPELESEAYITGIHQWVMEPDDPLKHGFLLGEMGECEA